MLRNRVFLDFTQDLRPWVAMGVGPMIQKVGTLRIAPLAGNKGTFIWECIFALATNRTS